MSHALQLVGSESLANGAAPWLDRNAYPFALRSLQLPEGRVHYLDEGE